MAKSKSRLVLVLALAGVLAGLILYLNSSIQLVPPVFIPGGVVTVRGTVLGNVVNSYPDQPMFLRVRKDGGIMSGSEVRIIYHADNRPCAPQGMSIVEGETVIAHGLAVEETAVSVCGDGEYFLRRAPQPDG